MKKGFLLVVLALWGQCLLLAQDGIHFQNSNWTEVLDKAATENKLIFVDAFTTWCGPCKQMVKEVFPKKEVADFYNKSFINYTIDMEKGEGPKLAQTYKVALYPTLLFIASDGSLVHRAAGFHNAEQLIELGNAAMDPSRQLSKMEERFDKGDRDPDFLKQYIELRAATFDGSHVPVAEAYMETQKSWNTPDNRSFIFKYMGGIDSKLFEHLVQNRVDYIQQFGEDAIKEKVREIVFSEISKRSTGDNLLPISEVKALYQKAYPSKAGQLVSEYKMSYYRSQGDRKNFAKAAIKYYKKYPSKNAIELNEIAWTFYSVINKKKYLKKALKWAQKSTQIEPAYYNHDTLAALYYKLGKKEKAMSAVEKAIELAKKEGYSSEAYAATSQLMQDIRNMR